MKNHIEKGNLEVWDKLHDSTQSEKTQPDSVAGALATRGNGSETLIQVLI